MLIDARELTAETVLRADVCIVGAGAAGITVARELDGTGLDVLVVESGDAVADARLQQLGAGEVTGLPLLRFADTLDLASTRLRFVGGTTNHWAGWCRPYDPIDFEPRAWMPRSGWPVTREELVPYYHRAAEVLEVAPELAPADLSPQGFGTALPASADVVTEIIQSKLNFSFGTRYRPDLERAANVRLVVWGTVTELLPEASGRVIEAAQLRVLDGPTVRIEARAFVLAAGGIEVPRLLLASRSVHPQGVGNDHDQVGRCFSEHLHVPLGLAVFAGSADQLGLYTARKSLRVIRADGTSSTVHPFAVLRLSDQLLRQEPLLGAEINVVHLSAPPGASALDQDLDLPELRALVGASNDQETTTVTFLALQAEQMANPESRVTLTGETDELGVPRTRLDWQVTTDDRRSIREAAQRLARALGQSGGARVRSDPGRLPAAAASFMGVDPARLAVFDFEGDTFPLGIGFHHMGTTRMATDARQGVVDPDCRVHGTENLYVASSAVFPTSGTATPTMTITALAIRLADLLKSGLAA